MHKESSPLHRWVQAFMRESPFALAREALWRTQKRWRQARLPDNLGRQYPLTYRPAGYYRLEGEIVSRSSRAAILQYADLICEGQFPWFGYGAVALGLPPRWNFDFASGKEWPPVPADAVRVVRHDGSDVKVPWELSRLQFLPVLGKAWVLTDEKRYREMTKILLSDWIACNPVGIGVNWTLAMEAALRSVSICLTLELLWPFVADEADWLQKVTNSIREHLLFIEAHNEFSHLTRSNHYLSNIVGMFTISCFVEGEAMAQRRQRYAHLIERELFHQTYDDGGNFEASTGYHVLALQMFTTALLLMRAVRLPSGSDFLNRLERMFSVLAAIANSRNNRVPHVGDCDDGRVELLTDDLRQQLAPAGERHSLEVGGLLGIGSALFSRGVFPADDAKWLGITAFRPSGDLTVDTSPTCFVRTGIARMRSKCAEVLFFAMPNGIFGRGSHTHNDKLSLTATIRGVELLADSGTGCYTRNAEMRNRFRSTAAHNTIMVDGEEQNRISRKGTDLFRMGNEAEVSPILTKLEEGKIVLEASHFGYRRIGVIHTRRVILQRDQLITIEDNLEGNGQHRLELFFHLGPEWRASDFHRADQALACEVRGPEVIRFRWSAPLALLGEQEMTKISRCYGATYDATRFRIDGLANLPLQVKTTISWDA